LSTFPCFVQIVCGNSHIREMIDKIRLNQDFMLIGKKKDAHRGS